VVPLINPVFEFITMLVGAPVIEYVKSSKPVIARRLEQAKEIKLDENLIIIICEAGSAQSDYLKRKESQSALDILIKDFFSNGHKLKIVETETENGENNKNKVELKAEKKERLKNDPVIKEAIEVFGGRVISIKPNNKE